MVDSPEKDWELTQDDGSDFESDHINSEIPESMYDSLLWTAVHKAILESNSDVEVIHRIKIWNKKNQPQLDEKTMLKKVLWALNHWDVPWRQKKA